MTASTTRHVNIWVFALAMLLSSVFYIVLLRQFGALPEIRRNSKMIVALEQKIDSLCFVVRMNRGSMDPVRGPR